MTADRTWEAAAHIYATFNLPEAVMGDLHALLQHADSLELIGASRHLRLLVEAAHSHTWFCTQGVAEPSSSAAGSRPGDPLGDVFFTAAILRVLTM
eukprot:9641450-Lingulodinium_polyedra.AAC.1